MAQNRPTIKVYRGADKWLALTTSLDLEGSTISSQIRDQNGEGAIAASFICNPGLNGRVNLHLSKDASSDLVGGKTDYCFDVRIALSTGEVVYSPRVWLNVLETVTQA